MRSSAARAYSLLFLLSGATGLVYELLWVRLLYQAFGSALQPSLGRLYGLNTLGAVLGTALAGFFLIEYVGIRASLWGTALVNLSIGVVALRLPDPRGEARGESADRGREPGEAPAHALQRVALLLLALTAFASLLDEIAWTRVLVMIVGGSTYAFTLVLLVFLLGIGVGSAVVARRRAPASAAAADAALAQGVTAAGPGALFVVFGLLPRYIIAVF